MVRQRVPPATIGAVEVQGQPATYRAGCRDDFDRLYEATYPRVFATLVALLGDRLAAEDCAQEAYLRAFAAWPRWRPDAPAEAWVHRIAINVAVSHRRRERLREVGQLVLRLGPPRSPDPFQEASTPELLRELRQLPPKQAAALVLRHVHGYSNREIAQSLGVPERTVASRLAAARARLQARLRCLRDSGTRLGLGVPSDR
jgi:RNA polymerase sigma-70 factor (ECF subfamily)